MLEVSQHALAVESCAGVIPGDCLDWGLIQVLVAGDPGAVDIGSGEGAVVFDVDLLDAPEAPELPFGSIEETVVVGIAAAETCPAPLVARGHPAQAVDREWQSGHPGLSVLCIL